jgi:redox-sensitive bicupin YhaK (pirin superfamily)
MHTVIHKSFTRGRTLNNWLKSFHTFSFGGYYNPERTNFGALRVINDDYIAADSGFPLHPHDNMEIITVPLSGFLEHKDSKGHSMQLRRGEVQVMTTGTGIFHSEYNISKEEELHLLQIWIFPEKRNNQPRYDQKKFDFEKSGTNEILIASPNEAEGSLKINSNSWLRFVKIEKNNQFNYIKKNTKNGLYVFVISGTLTINETELTEADGIGIKDFNDVIISAIEPTELLLFEVPVV